nr:cytochrome c oxidase subunit 3, mitochondrial [Tanacetum cinerariifolium]
KSVAHEEWKGTYYIRSRSPHIALLPILDGGSLRRFFLDQNSRMEGTTRKIYSFSNRPVKIDVQKDPQKIPFLNTLIPLLSGAAVTWAHYAILAGKEKRAVYALVATVSLALVFTAFQGMEYYQAPSTISDSIYGSTFFLATGFHGFHVIIGTLFSIICGIRQYLGYLTKEHHVGFEAAAWY